MLSVIQAIRCYERTVYIELAGNEEYLKIIEGFPMADKVSSWNQPALGQLYMPNGSLPPYWKDYLSGFDCILAYTQARGILTENLKKVSSALVSIHPPFPPAGQQRHIVEHLLEGLKHLRIGKSLPIKDGNSCIPSHLHPRIYLKEDDKLRAKRFLQETGQTIPSNLTMMAIHPGSGSPKKCWPAENFARLCLRLNELLPLKICIIGGPADEKVFYSLKEMLKNLSPLLLKDLPLKTLAAILSNCDLYLGNDSGITHLAAALDIPTIALFGPTDPKVWAPLGHKVYILQGRVQCSPCDQERRIACPEPSCMSSICPENVLQICTQII